MESPMLVIPHSAIRNDADPIQFTFHLNNQSM